MAAKHDDRINDIVQTLDRFIKKMDEVGIGLIELRGEFKTNSNGLELFRKDIQEKLTDLKDDVRALQDGLNDSGRKNHEEIDAFRGEMRKEIMDWDTRFSEAQKAQDNEILTVRKIAETAKWKLWAISLGGGLIVSVLATVVTVLTLIQKLASLSD